MYNVNLRDQKKVLLCEDGTNTLYSTEFDEPYHSTKDGALYESLEKYVKPSFSLKIDKTALTILDICFGLGYNTFATLYYIKKYNIQTKVHILAPEFDESLVHSLDTFNYPQEFDMFKPIIKAIAKELYYEDAQFKIEILIGDARVIIPSLENKVDIVYQDAFSPAHNPLLWTREWFKDIKRLCYEDTVLTTYSTAAAIRLGLYESGFSIYIHHAPKIRYSTVASLKILDTFEYIDMELKKVRNAQAQSMRDDDYIILQNS